MPGWGCRVRRRSQPPACCSVRGWPAARRRLRRFRLPPRHSFPQQVLPVRRTRTNPSATAWPRQFRLPHRSRIPPPGTCLLLVIPASPQPRPASGIGRGCVQRGRYERGRNGRRRVGRGRNGRGPRSFDPDRHQPRRQQPGRPGHRRRAFPGTISQPLSGRRGRAGSGSAPAGGARPCRLLRGHQRRRFPRCAVRLQ